LVRVAVVVRTEESALEANYANLPFGQRQKVPFWPARSGAGQLEGFETEEKPELSKLRGIEKHFSQVEWQQGPTWTSTFAPLAS
jgi:hypothetical protein